MMRLALSLAAGMRQYPTDSAQLRFANQFGLAYAATAQALYRHRLARHCFAPVGGYLLLGDDLAPAPPALAKLMVPVPSRPDQELNYLHREVL